VGYLYGYGARAARLETRSLDHESSLGFPRGERQYAPRVVPPEAARNGDEK
jgi:hypothetical protein